jgi:predicted transcriptional regulator
MSMQDPFFDELDADREAADDTEGLADIEAGRVISQDEIVAWLATWGTPDEQPAPETWLR